MKLYLTLILSSLYLSGCTFGPSSRPRAEFNVQIHPDSFYSGKIIASSQFYKAGGRPAKMEKSKCFPQNLGNICSHKKYEAIEQVDALLITTSLNSEKTTDANLINEKMLLAAAQFALENGYQYLTSLATESSNTRDFMLVKDSRILKKGLFTNERWGLEPYKTLYNENFAYRNKLSAEKIFRTMIVKYGNVKYETTYPKTVASAEDQL